MEIHMEGGPNFIPDTGAQKRMQAFLRRYHGRKLVVLELGIGWRNQLDELQVEGVSLRKWFAEDAERVEKLSFDAGDLHFDQIGRASCRERV